MNKKKSIMILSVCISLLVCISCQNQVEDVAPIDIETDSEAETVQEDSEDSIEETEQEEGIEEAEPEEEEIEQEETEPEDEIEEEQEKTVGDNNRTYISPDLLFQ